MKAAPKAADFFAGCGLATEGLKGNFDVVWANDIDLNKAEAYRANHGTSHFYHAPIETFESESVPHHDLSWASFPCQDLSLAGKGLGIKAQRSGTVWEWLRIIDGLRFRPRVVVAENVLGLLTGNKGANYKSLHDSLGGLGYKCGALVINAKHWVPQSRVRVFVVGVQQSVDTSEYELQDADWGHPTAVQRLADRHSDFVLWKLPFPKAQSKSLESVIDFSEPVDFEEKRDRNLALITDAHWGKIRKAEQGGSKVFTGYKRIRGGEQRLEIRTDGIAGCLRTPSGGSSRQHVLIPSPTGYQTRLLSIGEAARLMGARRTYKFPGSYNDGYKALGDAVAVPVVRHLAKHLLEPLLTGK